VAVALVGACLGFLWWNAAPAKIIMGDTGALAIGTGLGALCLLMNLDLLLIVIGGLFVAETASVILQVVSFRVFGRRVFRMAPFHHHFELHDWPETTVLIRFWIIAGLCAMLGWASSTGTPQDCESRVMTLIHTPGPRCDDLNESTSTNRRCAAGQTISWLRASVSARQLQRSRAPDRDGPARDLRTIAVASASEGQSAAGGGSQWSIMIHDVIYLGFGIFALYAMTRIELISWCVRRRY